VAGFCSRRPWRFCKPGANMKLATTFRVSIPFLSRGRENKHEPGLIRLAPSVAYVGVTNQDLVVYG
jgi:hypothetical protein